MVRADVFNEVGGFDEGYNYGFEDTDLCLKILERGGSVGCARDAVAIHGEGGTRSLCGKQDHHNGEYFIQRWEKKLPDLLREYRRKMNGVDIRVEGA
jgi:GT2 family glycosyltransferase